MIEDWPESLPVAQVRVARPTDKLQEVERFYCEGIGLRKLGSFENHQGYNGIMIGLPGLSYHLEFTQHAAGSPCPAPSRDNLLVLYLPDEARIRLIVQRLEEMGHPEVAPENPYWKHKGAITVEDPDGWRLVLMPTAGIGTEKT
ncbi:VOC family protein [Pontibacter brevis]